MKALVADFPMAPTSGLSTPKASFRENEKKEGKITAYAIDMKMGVIKTHDDKRYVFSLTDMLQPETLELTGTNVTFETSGNIARKIRIVRSS